MEEVIGVDLELRSERERGYVEIITEEQVENDDSGGHGRM